MKSIFINTQNTSLVFTLDNRRTLFHCYFGTRLDSSAMPEALLPTDELQRENPPVPATFGGKYTGEPALKVTHADGNMTTELCYQSHEQIPIDENIRETHIQLRDAYYSFYVILIYRAYYEEDIITSRLLIKNEEAGSVALDRFSSFDLSLADSEYWLTHFYGDWSAEMQMEEEKLGKGIRMIDSKKGVRATRSANPSFLLALGHPAEEEEGAVIGGALAWSGNFQLCFELDVRDQLHVTAGINPFGSTYHLKPGKTFETPECIFTYSQFGKGPVTRRFHRWARRYVLRDSDRLRPVVMNSWEGAYFSFDENVLVKMMSNAAKLGVELFVLDDGWFGNKYPRNDETVGLGDWQVNAAKLPSGLDHLIDHAEKEGLRFGIWIEPEMVNPKSELAEAHPEWIIQRPNREQLLWRNQLILDLCNPAVRDFVFKTVDHLLTAHPRIAYIKWDCNRHIENFGSSYLSKDRQSHLWIDYVHGLYAVYDRLMKKYPHVLFQACASGGGRVDFGALARHHEFWTSDNTDAFSRVFIQWGTGHFYPAMAMAAHVSDSPNHQTGALSPLRFRFDVAMTGRLGMELQPADMTEDEMEFAKRSIAEYKRIRDVIQTGDLYRLISPYNGYRSSLMYVVEGKGRAVVFAYVSRFCAQQDFPVLRLRGLDTGKTYRVVELNRNAEESLINENGQSFKGGVLMDMGLHLRIEKTGDSLVLEIVEDGLSAEKE